MKEWQENYILENLEKLTNLITQSKGVLVSLKARELFSHEEVQKLEKIAKYESTVDLASGMLDLIVTKHEDKDNIPAYDAFIDILVKHKQSQAAEILKEGKKRNKQVSSSTFDNAVPASDSAVLVSSTSQLPTTTASTRNLLTEYELLIANGGNLVVDVEKPSAEMKTIFKNCSFISGGVALIINIEDFEDPEINRDGSAADVNNMVQLCEKLGFHIFEKQTILTKKRWTRQNILDFISKFKEFCVTTTPEAIIVFIGSHGEHGYIVTSDKVATGILKNVPGLSAFAKKDFNKIALYEEVYFQFYDKKCPVLTDKIKLFLVSSCQVFSDGVDSVTDNEITVPDGTVTMESSDDITVIGSPVSNLIIFQAQAPGLLAWRNKNNGSWFAHCLTFFIMKCAKDTDLFTIFNMVQTALQKRNCVIPSHIVKKYPGQSAFLQQSPVTQTKIYFDVPISSP